MTWFQVFILSLIEGLTEFLPVSSTGHIVLFTKILGIPSTDFIKLFTVAVQLGAIVAVVVLYFKRFFQTIDFYLKLFVAFLPAAVFGVLLGDMIDNLLESPLGIGISLFCGGVIFIFIDRWLPERDEKQQGEVTYRNSLFIGLFQCIALIPGVSRSGATIVGGMAQKFSRKAAAEFSFFLAVPTMFGATAKKLYDFLKIHGIPEGEQIKVLCIGNLIAFIVAIFGMKFFVSLLTRYGFKIFGWYRILIGIVIILTAVFYSDWK